MTIIYFVRHAESPFIEGKERSRELSAQGSHAAERVKEMLLDEGIDAILSSPYQRAKDTVQPLADALGLPIAEQEDLRERMAGDLQGHSFLDAKKKLFQDSAFSFPGGESGKAAQSRAIRAFEIILNAYGGKRVAIGTHGDIMTLMLQHYDERFDYHFWLGTTLPDIYRAEFEEGRLVNLARLWSEHQEEG
ncbi:histidine phosphatase family protein [Paenibacillus sp. JNUCC32]|uniref:histidine phosphatase family protein n=1 Tax=Paenibacillus TaxID=44249 RepID=UPI000BBDB116|nr:MULTISPECIES: histidine phosphatase family protein [Paenibacillus]PCL89994.1 histidine phosphatase family protein [Paenibacillus lautus]QOT11270.1 histidine phosphatase family protein [Paenibacillus sp. JNUCC-32]